MMSREDLARAAMNRMKNAVEFNPSERGTNLFRTIFNSPVIACIVCERELIDNIIEDIKDPRWRKSLRRMRFYLNFSRLTGVDLETAGVSAVMAFKDEAMRYGDAKILFITASLIKSGLDDMMEDWSPSDEYNDAVKLFNAATETARGAMTALSRSEDFSNYALLEKIEDLMGDINHIGLNLRDIVPEVETVARLKARNEQIDQKLRELIALLTKHAQKTKDLNEIRIKEAEKFVSDVMHGDACPCGLCRERDLRDKINYESAKSMKSMMAEMIGTPEPCGCDCGGAMDERFPDFRDSRPKNSAGNPFMKFFMGPGDDALNGKPMEKVRRVPPRGAGAVRARDVIGRLNEPDDAASPEVVADRLLKDLARQGLSANRSLVVRAINDSLKGNHAVIPLDGGKGVIALEPAIDFLKGLGHKTQTGTDGNVMMQIREALKKINCDPRVAAFLINDIGKKPKRVQDEMLKAITDPKEAEIIIRYAKALFGSLPKGEGLEDFIRNTVGIGRQPAGSEPYGFPVWGRILARSPEDLARILREGFGVKR